MTKQIHIAFRAMNTNIEVQLELRHGTMRTEQYANLIRGWFEQCEQRFSRFLAHSELTLLNASNGDWMLLSDMMFDVLAKAERYRVWTEGWFSIHILQALIAAGYDRSFEKIAAERSCNIYDYKPVPDYEAAPPNYERFTSIPAALELNDMMKSARLAGGQAIDLGGIAKSWTVAQAASWLRQTCSIPAGLINAGGDAAVWNENMFAPQAVFTVSAPDNELDTIATLMLHNGAVATSNTIGRSWSSAGGIQHHLINPYTGKSSQSDIVQATVVGMDVTTCEVWAKVLCLAGTSGLALMQRRNPNYEALIVKRDGIISLMHSHERSCYHWESAAEKGGKKRCWNGY